MHLDHKKKDRVIPRPASVPSATVKASTRRSAASRASARYSNLAESTRTANSFKSKIRSTLNNNLQRDEKDSDQDLPIPFPDNQHQLNMEEEVKWF